MSGGKKFNIKPFSITVPMEKEKASELWSSLSKAVDKIYSFQASVLSFEELYRNAYNMCIHKHAEMLYHNIAGKISEFNKIVAEDLITTPDGDLLAKLLSKWTDHKTCMTMIRDILMYMDRTYVTTNKLTPVFDVGLESFRDNVVADREIVSRIKKLLLENVHKEREGEIIDRNTMRGVLTMMVEVGVNSLQTYQTHFEEDFLAQTRLFYSQEAQKFIDTHTCPDFVRKAENRISEEKDRIAHYINGSSEVKLMETVDECFITKNAQALVDMENSGCTVMFTNDRINDMQRLYELFSRVPSCLRIISVCMKSYITSHGQQIITDPENRKNPISLISQLLSLREKFNSIVQIAFKRDSLMEICMKDSFEEFINVNTRTALSLSQYLDNFLKRDMKSLREEEIEIKIDQVITIFRYITDKDIFENYYKIHVSKRLLNAKSLSDDVEKLILRKLKSECGYQFTAKIEGMFTDINLSAETMDDFSKVEQLPGMELDVKVLTAGFWPSDVSAHAPLPWYLRAHADFFMEFYLSRHTGRKLAWKTGLGTADIRAFMGPNRVKHEFIMSTYQMYVIMLFNTYGTLTVLDISDELQIPARDLDRHILGLVATKILTKNTRGKEINDQSILTLNADYSSKLYRQTIPIIQKKEKEQEKEIAVPQMVEEDRKHLMEAVIVRIMKSRRKVEHNTLMAEVSKQLAQRFIPDASSIKRRIENLIEREYMDRDPENAKFYHYLA